MFEFTNISVQHSDGDDVASRVDEKDDNTTTMVANKKMKAGMTFVDIVCDSQSPKSVTRVNPIMPVHKKHLPHKK